MKEIVGARIEMPRKRPSRRPWTQAIPVSSSVKKGIGSADRGTVPSGGTRTARQEYLIPSLLTILVGVKPPLAPLPQVSTANGGTEEFTTPE